MFVQFVFFKRGVLGFWFILEGINTLPNRFPRTTTFPRSVWATDNCCASSFFLLLHFFSRICTLVCVNIYISISSLSPANNNMERLKKDRKITSRAGHMGWLKKKGKRRWFLLQGSNLYWFAKEQKVKIVLF